MCMCCVLACLEHQNAADRHPKGFLSSYRINVLVGNSYCAKYNDPVIKRFTRRNSNVQATVR